jgi:hypothetical protein
MDTEARPETSHPGPLDEFLKAVLPQDSYISQKENQVRFSWASPAGMWDMCIEPDRPTRIIGTPGGVLRVDAGGNERAVIMRLLRGIGALPRLNDLTIAGGIPDGAVPGAGRLMDEEGVADAFSSIRLLLPDNTYRTYPTAYTKRHTATWTTPSGVFSLSAMWGDTSVFAIESPYGKWEIKNPKHYLAVVSCLRGLGGIPIPEGRDITNEAPAAEGVPQPMMATSAAFSPEAQREIVATLAAALARKMAGNALKPERRFIDVDVAAALAAEQIINPHGTPTTWLR